MAWGRFKLRMGSLGSLLVGASLVLVLHSAGLVSADDGFHGIASWYDKYHPSACYGDDLNAFPTNGFFAAASSTFWKGGAVCGDFYWVQCLSKCTSERPVLVRIVDNCPAGCASTIDLSKAAFRQLADLDTGLINVSITRLQI